MIKETQTPQEKETEEIRKKYIKKSVRNLVMVALGIPIILGGEIYSNIRESNIELEEPPIMNTYNDAGRTLSNLNSQLQILEEQSYIPKNLDEELRHVFIPPRQDLEKSIEIVERDIQTIEDTSNTLKNYNESKEMAHKVEHNTFLYTFLTALGLCGFGFFNQSKIGKVRSRKLEEVKRKYGSSQ